MQSSSGELNSIISQIRKEAEKHSSSKKQESVLPTEFAKHSRDITPVKRQFEQSLEKWLELSNLPAGNDRMCKESCNACELKKRCGEDKWQ